MLRRLILGCVVVILLGLAGFFAYAKVDQDAAVKVDGRKTGGGNAAQVERGRYLAIAADCEACHTIPGQNQPFAGGRPIETPFGNVVSSNITPDKDTGIGSWSDAAFEAALRHGRARDGVFLYPAMPFTSYTKLSHDDVIDIRAYLSTVTPVRNAIISNRLPFPLNIRSAMMIWDGLYFYDGTFTPDPNKSPEWNRGAYLVEAAGHCGACHTAKTLLGADEIDKRLQGAVVQGWFAPDITSDRRTGLGNWSVDDIVSYLKTGHNWMTAATGPMAEEVEISSSRMTDKDLHAIATYLKDRPAGGEILAPIPADDPQMKTGGAVFLDECRSCHGADGKGIPRLFPALASSSNVRSNDPTSLIRIVLRGARSANTQAEPTAPAMPAFGWLLSNEQVAAVLTYIRNSWGSAAPTVTAEAVRESRASLALRDE